MILVIDKDIIAKLEQKIAYSFADVEILEKALTHSSAISPGNRVKYSYQRLEFLGDRVLGLVIADILLKRFVDSNEGDLSRTLNALVRKETLAKVALGIELGSFINLGESEARSGGAKKEAILADVMEAIIGAIYVDGGHDKAYKLVEKLFSPMIETASESGADAKTFLQEWAQGKRLATPKYTEISRTGPDHVPIFTIEVGINGYEKINATGASKKTAEHSAAEKFLIKHQIWENK